MRGPVLEVRDLKTLFKTEYGPVEAVSRVNFNIYAGETVALVGESGCGKSVTARSIMRILPSTGKTMGQVRFDNVDLMKLGKKEMARIRGDKMTMVFQEPMTSLNPILKIGTQVGEPLRMHTKQHSRRQLSTKVVDLLNKVGIPRAVEVAQEYPHQLSGGMRQRVMIAMAIACNPELLIADEPTTALDVTVQAQILELLRFIQMETELSLLLITHNLGVVAEMCQRVIVMYAGEIIEESTVEELFSRAFHPYTRALLMSVPNIHSKSARLSTIPGTVPSIENRPKGCRFAPRCQFAMEICRTEEPGYTQISPSHRVSCWLAGEEVQRDES